MTNVETVSGDRSDIDKPVPILYLIIRKLKTDRSHRNHFYGTGPLIWSPVLSISPPIQFSQEITSKQFWEPAKVILSKWPIKSVEPVRQSVEHVRQSVVTFRQSDRLAYRFDKSHWSWSVWLEKNSLALDKMTWTESWKESSTKEEPGSDRSPRTVFKC